MKKSIFLLAIICALAFVSATQKSSAWGEDITPWKVVTVTGCHKVYNGNLNGWGMKRFGDAYNIKYKSSDSTLIYTIFDTTNANMEFLNIPKILFRQNLYNNEISFDTLKHHKQLFPYFECLISEDGNYYYYTDADFEDWYGLVNVKTDSCYYTGWLPECKIFLRTNDYLIVSSPQILLYGGKGSLDGWFSRIIAIDTLGKTVADYRTPENTEYKPVYFMAESNDGKYIVAYHSAPLGTHSGYNHDFYTDGEPEYRIGCIGHYFDRYIITSDTTWIKVEDTACVGLFRLYKADDITKNYDILNFIFPSDSIPSCDSATKITKRNIPFRFSCGGKKLIMQNIFGQDLGGGIPTGKNPEYYCFSRDMENISEADHAPTDTFYLGYPLKNAYWVNNDKNVLILDDSTNHITVLETENYSIVNEINLKSSNGRKLNLCRIYPEDDLIIGYNDPAGDTLGNIELFKISGIAGVNDEKPITSVLYPNPATQSATLELNLPSSNEIDLDISDLSGRFLRTQNCGRLASGVNSIAINTSAFSSGSYFVTARGNNYSKTFKLIINK